MTASNAHTRDTEAAEYAIGVMDPAERRAFERDMAADPALAAAARSWEERLVALAEAVPPVAPSPAVSNAIEARLNAEAAPNVIEIMEADFLRLRRSVSIWRSATVAAGSLAAALVLYFGLRTPVPVGSAGQLVAVVNRSGDLPALIVRVDPATRLVHVRSVSTETPAGHSLELWSVAPGASPRSLGLVGSLGTRVSLPATSGPLAEGLTLAVSVEPQGGSPTGLPTGPVVYTGKLVPDAQ